MKKLILLLLVSGFVFGQTKLEDANKLILKSKFSEAAEILKEYIDENENANAYLKLGVCYKNLMKNNEAIIYLEKANELQPDDLDILINLASTYAAVKFNGNAIKSYEEVLTIDSTNTFASINLAKLYLEQNKLTEAKHIFEKLLNGDSTNSYYNRQLGYVYQKEENVERAFKFYSRAFELNSADVFTASNLAKILYQKEKPDSAIAIVNKGLKSFPRNTQLLKIKADIYYSQKNYASAVNSIVRIIANGDESAQLYQRLGICYHQIAVQNFVGEAQNKKLESAVEALNKSIELDSTQSLTQLYLGMTYKELEKHEEAITHLNKAVELIYPIYTSAIFTNLAIVFSREEKYAEAIKNFKLAKKFDQDNPNYYYYLASTYDQYYYDKQVPMIYYQMYLSSGDSLDPALQKYARTRIEELKETVHFQNGSSSK